ncbi:hypothetical protein DL770_008044 [Monosporascus sp. CRB-9-2]|nr:hypothetical protein DL770_008044 [Monosporascus sp. CRB-9-2]
MPYMPFMATSGSFPYCGPPISAHGSVTYHMWTMIGSYQYVLYSGDVTFYPQNWASYLEGMKYFPKLVDPATDLIYVPRDVANDWGQSAVNEFQASAQTLFFHTLVTGGGSRRLVGSTASGDAGNNLWPTPRAGIHSQNGNSRAVLFGIIGPSSSRTQDISSSLTQNWTPIGAASPELPGETSPFISSFKIQADLSTTIEGYLVNGTFGYRWDYGYNGDFSYTSHAHSWATGPITALTEHVLGLSIVEPAGSTWRLALQFGNLTSCQGGFSTKLGRFPASWRLRGEAGYRLDYDTPKGTASLLLLPKGPQETRVVVDGIAQTSLDVVEASGNRLLLALHSNDGKHRIEVSWAPSRF